MSPQGENMSISAVFHLAPLRRRVLASPSVVRPLLLICLLVDAVGTRHHSRLGARNAAAGKRATHESVVRASITLFFGRTLRRTFSEIRNAGLEAPHGRTATVCTRCTRDIYVFLPLEMMLSTPGSRLGHRQGGVASQCARRRYHNTSTVVAAAMRDAVIG